MRSSTQAAAQQRAAQRRRIGAWRALVLTAAASCGRWGYDDTVVLDVADQITSGGSEPASLASCADGVISGQETDLDCGGPECPPCADTLACVGNADCASARCASDRCEPPGCTDSVRGESETAVDCGGDVCAPCPIGLGCAVNDDCQSQLCVSGVCGDPSCSDGLRSGDETGIDCGGGACTPCSAGGACDDGADCSSAVCAASVCQAPSCSDAVANGTESDVDCGGADVACARCGLDASCSLDSDCATSICRQGLCRAPGCDDGVQNSGEPAVDCGGACGSLCTTLTSALVHRYRFDGSGTTITDSIGGSHGALRNTTLSGTGTASLSGGFSDQYVSLPDNLISVLDDATFETWLTWDGGYNQRWQRIFDFGVSSAGEGRQEAGVSFLALSPQGNDISNFIVLRYCSNRGFTGNCRNDGLEFDARAPMPLASGVVAHVVAVFDDTNNVMRIHVDGGLVASRSNNRRLSEIIDVNNWLGRSQFSGDPELNGHLHEFRIYARALSAAEIQYSHDHGPDPSFLP